MNRILAITLCAIMLVCAASCNQAGQDEIQTTQEQGQEADWSFLSDGERQTWEADLYDLLCAGKFYEEREYGCYGLALMDLNFDCVPEVLAAYRGGSMGNVFTPVHELRTGEELY